MSGRVIAIVLALLSFSATALLADDPLVIVGAGESSPWDTDFVLANGAAENSVWIGLTRGPSPCLSCPGRFLSLPPRGTAKITAHDVLLPFGAPGIRTFFVDPVPGIERPTVTARVFNRSRPSQAIELPVVRLSTIAALDPTVLSFPSARRSADSHSNLVLSEVSVEQGRDLSILVEAYSAAGDRLGSAEFAVSPGTTLFLVDALAQLGISSLEDGQVRVTKTGGTGLMWGLLTMVFDDGRVSVSQGVNP